MAHVHAAPFALRTWFSRAVGDDGLTARERRREAKKYLAAAGCLPSKADMDAREARMKANRASGNRHN
jgi:hypothetical protein